MQLREGLQDRNLHREVDPAKRIQDSTRRYIAHITFSFRKFQSLFFVFYHG
ncbi:hypothetical protein SAMN04488574_104333 [Bacillus sp. 71mf]|nr:hypothetical protein SAMN04488574_104333 [Bacillus sp. 71mf]SFS84680.1 hypothetical protein SAMN04488145_10433 [Bacillus sp. 103mf]